MDVSRALINQCWIFKVIAENLVNKPHINWAVKRVTRSLQVLWPRSRTNIFGSNATGLSLPTSDVDLVVCLPPVRNLVIESHFLHGLVCFLICCLLNQVDTC